MSSKTENLIPVRISRVNGTAGTQTDGADHPRKSFVEPEVSFPVDVLEATTFFQSTESGVTLP
ncbi:MAG TPA: hypothetical protein VN282_16165 [Pyrinomonadaceae bacterium]|nr:hypothetical protein [Pyrinomonadaceae bacterium]